MSRSADLVLPQPLYDRLTAHLFPGDHDEHAAVIAAGLVTQGGRFRLLARELFIAEEGSDYCRSTRGYKALQAPFIHRCITYCRDQRLVYLAIHNHGGTGSVEFSRTDYESHERGYPALLDIASGMPVGALVLAQGAIELDLWFPDGHRTALREARVVGESLTRIYANFKHCYPPSPPDAPAHYERQVLMFGAAGQRLLRSANVAIIGLGGIGSLVNEYLARLGVGNLVLIDPDTIETTNFSRVVGATTADLPRADRMLGSAKVAIAARVAHEAQPGIVPVAVVQDFTRASSVQQVLDCDFIFLAADTMRARLLFNAIVQQYYIPGVQLGSKVTSEPDTQSIEAAFSVVRQVRPGTGCLWCNQLIDPTKLSQEWKTDHERSDQQYGTLSPNPSVITLNAIAAAHAVNDFLFYFLALKRADGLPPYARFDHLARRMRFEEPRKDPTCVECSPLPHSRLGRGGGTELPCVP